MVIHIARQALSDGSHVFDVILDQRHMAAITEGDAVALAEKISEAIAEHTNDEAKITQNF